VDYLFFKITKKVIFMPRLTSEEEVRDYFIACLEKPKFFGEWHEVNYSDSLITLVFPDGETILVDALVSALGRSGLGASRDEGREQEGIISVQIPITQGSIVVPDDFLTTLATELEAVIATLQARSPELLSPVSPVRRVPAAAAGVGGGSGQDPAASLEFVVGSTAFPLGRQPSSP
jgi:hypothetical protein